MTLTLKCRVKLTVKVDPFDVAGLISVMTRLALVVPDILLPLLSLRDIGD